MFDRTFDATPGAVVQVLHGEVPVRRVTASNTGPMTFAGTNSYLVGDEKLLLIDPGPDDEAHLNALLKAVGNTPVEAICVTHTHRDHSPLARQLKQITGAPIVGADVHVFARSFQPGDAPVDHAADEDHVADRVLMDGDVIDVGSFALQAIATPGHTMNHLCFSVPGQNILFSGDHVMAWSTTLVAPPDGAMTPYLESLQKLLERPETLYLPGHGNWLADAKPYVQALLDHRFTREASILAALTGGSKTIPRLVDMLYNGLDQRLHIAAGLSVLAHLERLETLGKATRSGVDQDSWLSL